jgi:hypothetical protein
MLIGPVVKLLMGAHKYADHDYQHLTPLAQCIFKILQEEGHKIHQLTPTYLFWMRNIHWITHPFMALLTLNFLQSEVVVLWTFYLMIYYIKGHVRIYDTQLNVETYNLWTQNPVPLDITNRSQIVENHIHVFAIENNNIKVPQFNLFLVGIGLFLFICSATIAKKRGSPGVCLMALGSLSLMVYALGCMLTMKIVDPEAFKINLNDRLLKCK